MLIKVKTFSQIEGSRREIVKKQSETSTTLVILHKLVGLLKNRQKNHYLSDIVDNVDLTTTVAYVKVRDHTKPRTLIGGFIPRLLLKSVLNPINFQNEKN